MADTPTLKLYNTLTREKAPFKPIDPDNVRMYVCGPTVYDFAHIGNARPAIVFDVMFRLLRHVYGEDKVTYVRNITDVDDKINARALRDYPGMELNAAIRLVTEKTDRQYQEDVKALGCLEPTQQPRATEHINGMVRIIQQLLDNGHAYVAQGEEGRETLFDVRSMPSYGMLSNRKLDQQQAGARVAVESHKRNPGDFVLWKESASTEPGWSASFVVSDENRDELQLNSNSLSIFGRPGWHIECSAMSQAYLGETFDIHGGGLDLIFPHHENEIAQSRCAHGTNVMANVWMHNGFLQVEGKKMSKSDGNFVTIYELLETEKFGGREWGGLVLRLAMLMTHYRQPIDFSLRRLEEAKATVEKWADYKIAINKQFGSDLAAVYPKIHDDSPILDDLNLHPLITEISISGAAGAKGDKAAALSFHVALQLLGFENVEQSSGLVANLAVFADGDEMEKIKMAVDARLELLKSKNFAEADKIRNDLLAQGIQLKDGKDPVTGERVTTWEVKR